MRQAQKPLDWTWSGKALVLTLGILVGCTTIQTEQGPTAEDGTGTIAATPPLTPQSCSSNSSPYSPARFEQRWLCNQGVVVRQYKHTGDADMTSGIGSAAARWNLGHGLPVFSSASAVTTAPNWANTSDHTVYVEFVDGTPTSGTYCGATDDTSFPIHITIARSGCGGNTVPYNRLGDLLGHEIGHAVGFQSGYYHSFGTEYVTTHCAMHLPSDLTTVNGGPCPSEVEDLFYIYRVRTPAPDMGRHVLTSFAVPTAPNDSVDLGSSIVVKIPWVGFDGGHLSLQCEEGHSPDPCTPADGSMLNYTWSASPGGRVSLSGTGDSVIVTGVGLGSVTISAVIDSSGPYEMATYLNADAQPRSVTLMVAPAHGVPTHLSKIAGDAQAAAVGTAVVTPPKVKVLDYYNAAVSGASVTYSVISGGGSATGTSPTSDGAGEAPVGSWTVGASAGSNTLRARLIVGGSTIDSVLFTATGAVVTAPSNFRRTDCVRDVGAGPDTLATYRLDWTNGSGAGGWEIVKKASNDTTGSMPVFVSGSGTAFTWTPSHISGTAGTQYFFLRNTFGSVNSRWVPMNSNPINSAVVDKGCRIVV